MTTQDYNKAVTLLIHLIVMNNAGAVARALREAGYEANSYIPSPEMEAALLQLHMADPDKFFDLMKSISWNYGDVETNKPEIRDELIKLSGVEVGSDTEKTEWWKTLLSLFSGFSPEPSAPTQTNTSPFVILGYALVIIVIIIAIIFIAKTFI